MNIDHLIDDPKGKRIHDKLDVKFDRYDSKTLNITGIYYFILISIF